MIEAFPSGHIFGFFPSLKDDGTIEIGLGECRDSNDTANMRLYQPSILPEQPKGYVTVYAYAGIDGQITRLSTGGIDSLPNPQDGEVWRKVGGFMYDPAVLAPTVTPP